MSSSRQGLLLGVAAYVMWGAVPLYWPLLVAGDPFELPAQRVLWSALTLGLLVLVLRRGRELRALVADRRTLRLLTIAALVISVNWTTYIWGVTHDRVVEASLGYFINPLVTVLLGVLVMGERLRRLQWGALALGAVAVAVIAVNYGHLPVIALVLAFSFGTYGLVKKKANAPAIESLTLETLIVSPIALAYVGYLNAQGTAGFGHHGVGQVLLYAVSGLVTGLPLVCFGAAATRIPMVTLGLLQYLAPILQFGLGLWWFHEDMPAGRWVGFGLVWLSLLAFTLESLQHRRRTLRMAEPVPV